jgi:hypothetical protein
LIDRLLAVFNTMHFAPQASKERSQDLKVDDVVIGDQDGKARKAERIGCVWLLQATDPFIKAAGREVLVLVVWGRGVLSFAQVSDRGWKCAVEVELHLQLLQAQSFHHRD